MPAEAAHRTAAALIIGNELLSGKVADANVVVLARTLRSIGVMLSRVVMVLDHVDTIAHEVRSLAANHDVVFTSGGVGPTHDDLTIDAVAVAFSVPVVASASIERMLRAHYREKITPGHLRMARVPEGARLVTSRTMPWPTVVVRNVWVLPGIPQIFAMKMPVVREELGEGAPFFSRAVYLKMDEGVLKPTLDHVVAGHPAVEIGSYPKWDEPRYQTQVTFDGVVEADVERARASLLAAVPAEVVICLDGSEPG